MTREQEANRRLEMALGGMYSEIMHRGEDAATGGRGFNTILRNGVETYATDHSPVLEEMPRPCSGAGWALSTKDQTSHRPPG